MAKLFNKTSTANFQNESTLHLVLRLCGDAAETTRRVVKRQRRSLPIVRRSRARLLLMEVPQEGQETCRRREGTGRRKPRNPWTAPGKLKRTRNNNARSMIMESKFKRPPRIRLWRRREGSCWFVTFSFQDWRHQQMLRWLSFWAGFSVQFDKIRNQSILLDYRPGNTRQDCRNPSRVVDIGKAKPKQSDFKKKVNRIIRKITIKIWSKEVTKQTSSTMD